MSMSAVARASAAESRRSPIERAMPPASRRSAAALFSRTSAVTRSPFAVSDRARCPPVNPVAPVTRTRTSAAIGHERHRRSEPLEQAKAVEDMFDARREPAGSEHLVKGDRQHKLSMYRPHAETAATQRVDDRGMREH